MNRKYSVRQYLDKVDQLRAVCPEIALTTDMIIGFPGESEDDFADTMHLLETVRYNGSFSFKYSDRPGTRAEQLDSKIAEQVKSERLQIFQKRQDEISLEKNRRYLGKVVRILVEKTSDTGIVGRTSTNHIVHLPAGSKEAAPGDYLDVTVSFAGQHALKADLVST